MIVQVVPEEIVWAFLAQKIGKKPAEPLPYQKHFSRLPERLEVSEEFVDLWKKMVTMAVRREIVDTFRLRSFLVLERDQVRRTSIADPEFWKSLSLSFTEASLQAVWRLILSSNKAHELVLDALNPADALIVAIVERSLYQRFSLDRVLQDDVHWIVPALFLERQIHVNPAGLPWEPWLRAPQTVPLSLRELCIDKTASFFRSLGEGVRRQIENIAPLRAAVEGEPGRRPRPTGPVGPAAPEPPVWQPVRFRFDRLADVLHLHLDPAFSGESIRKAVHYWTGEGTLGLDDDRYINGAAQQAGLFSSLDSFVADVRAVFEIASEADVTLARSIP